MTFYTDLLALVSAKAETFTPATVATLGNNKPYLLGLVKLLKIRKALILGGTSVTFYSDLLTSVEAQIESTYTAILDDLGEGKPYPLELETLLEIRALLADSSGESIDLTAPPTSIGTITPPAITVSTIFRSANSGNVAFVAQSSGTGAFQVQQTDNTATGGNARGANAIDLQASRTAATQVASGISSVVCGSRNTASNSSSVALGDNNTASGAQSVALGLGNTASGAQSVALGSSTQSTGATSISLGNSSITKSVSSLLTVGSLCHSGAGKSQVNVICLSAETTNATPTVLRSNTSAASAANQLVLQNNSSIAFFGLATATITGGGDTASWIVQGCVKRGANAASTALVGTPTVTSIGANAGAAAWTLAITADTTNGCAAFTATNGAGVTVRVNLSLFASEVAF